MLDGHAACGWGAYLFIEILFTGEVCDRRIDATAKILKNHGVYCDFDVAG
jgi:hypothetical protein